MKVFRSRRSFLAWRNRVRSSVGFVPTMGALHEGHLSLVRAARRENECVVVSIFVNPLQFGPKEDFSHYPRTLRADLDLLKSLKVEAMFAPASPAEIYPHAESTEVRPPESLAGILEGRFRPGHFTGVATVVLKLFALVRPDRAYFGEKDFQQVRVVDRLVEDFFLPIKLRILPTRRSSKGLALSSRNRFLSAEDTKRAELLPKVLKEARSPEEARRRLKAAGFRIDYLECWDDQLTSPRKSANGRWLAAVRLSGLRLIDNCLRRSRRS